MRDGLVRAGTAGAAVGPGPDVVDTGAARSPDDKQNGLARALEHAIEVQAE